MNLQTQILEKLTALNLDFTATSDHTVSLNTTSGAVDVTFKIHYLKLGMGFQLHHFSFYGESVSSTGYRSHFFQLDSTKTITLEKFAITLFEILEEIQEATAPLLAEKKIVENSKKQLSLF